VLLASWAIWLRVAQYGWSAERVIAAAVTLIAAGHAAGYAFAALRPQSWLKGFWLKGAWLRGLETTNAAMAHVTLILFLALFSPVADPARLMVASQVGRLTSGALPPARFDFVALKLQGARWGVEALTALSKTRTGPDAREIARDAAQALAATNRGVVGFVVARQPPKNVTVYPAGRRLPPEFDDANAGLWPDSDTPYCFPANNAPCIARFVTLSPGGREQILFADNFRGWLFEQGEDNRWRLAGVSSGPLNCLRQALASGAFQFSPHPWPDLTTGGHRVTITDFPSEACPPDVSANPSGGVVATRP
jgi:hypothetical protein